MTNHNNNQELIIERLLAAPRAKVWQAWTDPQQMQRWWGPKEFTAHLTVFQVRPPP